MLNAIIVKLFSDVVVVIHGETLINRLYVFADLLLENSLQFILDFFDT